MSRDFCRVICRVACRVFDPTRRILAQWNQRITRDLSGFCRVLLGGESPPGNGQKLGTGLIGSKHRT